MTSLQVKYILTLAEMRSFSKAAQKLFISQPSLSKYISTVEKQLGIILFDRSTTPIALTPSGEAYVEAAKKITAIEESFMNHLNDIDELMTGSLRIGASTFRTSFLLSRSISKFCNEYNRISVSIMDDNTEQLKEKLKNGEIDLMIGTGDFNIRDFDYEELAVERVYIAVPKDHPLNELLVESRLTCEDIRTNSIKCLTVKPIDTEKLSSHPFIVTSQGEFGEESISQLLKQITFQPEIALRVRTIEAAFSFVVAGFGISIIPDTLIKFGNYTVHPYYYSIEESISTRSIRLVLRKNAYLSRAAKEYCLTLKKLIDVGTWRIS